MSSIKKEIKLSLHQRPWLVQALLKLYLGSRHTYVRARSNLFNVHILYCKMGIDQMPNFKTVDTNKQTNTQTSQMYI